jgi:dTDP-glucose 4,6-dehydratase
MSTTALVTGAAGFIGSHLVEELVRRGYDVRAMVRYNSRGSLGNLDYVDPDLLAGVEIVRGDIRDVEFVGRAVADREVVFHLAASISIPYSYSNPREVVETNVTGTLNVLSAARASSTIRRAVLTSTSEVFGTAQYVPIDEAHPLCPQSPYAATKVSSDKLGESFHKSFGVPVVVLRPFNTFGPRQPPRAIIPTLILQALGEGEIRLGQLDSTRDFTYVLDTVRGFIACAEGGDETLGGTFNIGSGKEISIGDLRDLILEIADCTRDTVVQERRLRPAASEVMRLLCDSSRAREVLGWTPEVSLREGLRRTLDWFSANRDKFATENYLI